MNAIKFLLKEHDTVRRILADISDDSHRYETKRAMFDDLCADLVKHETTEEKVWYPFLKKNGDFDHIIKELVTEEKDAGKEIKEFKKWDQAEWEVHFPKFKKAVLHHAHLEETKLFPKVEKTVAASDLDAIGMQMKEFKSEL
jgi:hemerythrin superfamily protein